MSLSLSTPSGGEGVPSTTDFNHAANPTQTSVLFVIYGLEPAGPELRLLDFARLFPATTQVHICVIGNNLTLLNEFNATTAKIVLVPVRRAYTEWGQIRKILSYIHTQRIDTINSFDLKTLIVCLVAKLRYGNRIRWIHHIISLWEDQNRKHQAFLRWAMRYTDHIICNGYAVKETVIGERSLRVPVSVVPNGVDTAHFCPSDQQRLYERQRLGFTPDDFVLGTVANVRPVKNYPLLIHTAQRLILKHPFVRLVCVGGGSQFDEMNALTDQLGLRDRTLFTGAVKDVRPFLSTFDAFALCSLKEGCPNSLMQAMAMAIPTVGSAVGEVPYLLDGGASGLLFEPGDTEGLLFALSRLVTDKSYRINLGQSGRRRMVDTYSGARMINEYVSIFQRLAAEPR